MSTTAWALTLDRAGKLPSQPQHKTSASEKNGAHTLVEQSVARAHGDSEDSVSVGGTANNDASSDAPTPSADAETSAPVTQTETSVEEEPKEA